MPRLLVWGGLAVVLLIVLVSGGLLLSTGWAVAALQDRLQQMARRQVSVSGGAHVEFSPRLAIRFDDISVANGDGSEGPFITAPALRIPVDLAGLLSHHFELAELTLSDPRIALTIDSIGRTSWPRQATAGAAPLRLLMERGEVVFSDQRSGQTFGIADANLAVDFSPGGELSLSGSARLNRQIARVTGYLKDLSRLFEGGSPADISLDSPALSVDFSGRLSLSEALGLAGTVSVSGPDLRQALRWSGGDLGGSTALKTFSLQGALDSRGRAFAVHRAGLRLDDVSAEGDLSLDFRGDVPQLQAVLASQAMALDPYIPRTGWSQGDWGRVPLGFDGLRGLDATIALSAGQLTYGSLRNGPTNISATLAHGRLEVQLLGKAVSKVSFILNGAQSPPAFAAALEAADFDAAQTLAPLLGATWLAGKGRLAGRFTATGQTQQEMISALTGELHISLADGQLRGVNIAHKLAAVSREIVTGWAGQADAATNFTALGADFTIADGIANMTSLKLAGPSLTLSGTGDIDLLRRAIDLRVDPRLATGRAGESTGLPVAIVVKGPWDEPRIYPDMAGILSDPKAAYGALRARGLPANSGAGSN